jgi:hypothetical protein
VKDSLAPLVQALELQGAACARFGSDFSALVARAVATDIAADGAFAELARPFAHRDTRALLTDAVPLRFLGALHFLALSGEDAELAALYPPNEGHPDPMVIGRRIGAAARAHAGFFGRFLESPPQTNEVNRSLALCAGFLEIVRRTGLPLRCLEIGASAGLNMNWDRYRYDIGGQGAWGDPHSPVSLAAEWSGSPPPLDVRVVVAEKKACDRAPIDLAVPEAALRLKAYVWPDQPERLARLSGAILLAGRFPPRIERADAGDWVRRNVTSAAGTVSVLYHSVVWPYLPPATQAQITAWMDAAGESATPTQPLAWLRMEPNPADLAAPLDLKLSIWPSGEEMLLARVHPHGVKVSWAGV